jgi:hypothetical protein
MARFDFEDFMDHFKDLIQDNLSAKVTEINAEKGDSLLSDIPDAQFFESLNDSVVNYDNFVLYFIENVESLDTVGADVSYTVTMTFAIIFHDAENWTNAERRILRYTRAFEEIILENAYDSSYIHNITVEPIEPDMLRLSENSPVVKAGGIRITGDITS